MSPNTPYSENNPDHVPNPLYQTGVVDTTGTTGDVGARIENISPVFAQHKAAALQNAVDAIDDPDVDENRLVVFHDGEDGHLSREEATEKLRAAARDASEDPQLDNPADTPAAREAAEESDEDNERDPSLQSGDLGPSLDPGFSQVEREEGRSDTGDAEPNSGQQDTDGEQGKDEGEDDSLPADTDSKSKWVAYADEHGLDVDQSLSPKAAYTDAVKAAKAKKDATG